MGGAVRPGRNAAALLHGSEGDAVQRSGIEHEFACVSEILFAVQHTFLTANRDIFEAMTDVERDDLLALSRETEAELWREIRPFELPAHLVAALRKAAEPEVERWAAAMGTDGATTVADYRRAPGFRPGRSTLPRERGRESKSASAHASP